MCVRSREVKKNEVNYSMETVGWISTEAGIITNGDCVCDEGIRGDLKLWTDHLDGESDANHDIMETTCVAVKTTPRK